MGRRAPLWEAGGYVIVDVGQLRLEVVGVLQDVLGALVGVLPRRHQLAASLQRFRPELRKKPCVWIAQTTAISCMYTGQHNPTALGLNLRLASRGAFIQFSSPAASSSCPLPQDLTSDDMPAQHTLAIQTWKFSHARVQLLQHWVSFKSIIPATEAQRGPGCTW